MQESDKFYYYAPSGLPGEAVAYIIGGHPGYRLEQGEPVNEWTIPHFDIGGFYEPTGQRTAGGRLTGFLNNSVDWVIVDKEVRDLLTAAGVGPEHVQWLDVCIHQDGWERVGEYFVANPLNMRAAVHPARSKFVGPMRSVTKIVLLRDAIRGVEIFRLRERPGRVFLSPRLKRLLTDAGVTGVEWIAVSVSD